MEEADRLCRQLSIIDNGKIVISGSPTDLKRQVGADSIKLSYEANESNEKTNVKAKKILKEIKGVKNIIDSDEGLTVYAKDAGFIIPDIVRAFDKNKIKLNSVSFSSPTLDDIFLKHTGRRIRTEELVKKPTGAMFGMRRR
jgi:ABC-2 type transport system ATP-binding protein